MNVVLAALGDSVSAGIVLQTAARLAPLVDASVVALHVREHDHESGDTARALADAAEVPLLIRHGAGLTDELDSARHQLHAIATVVGAGTLALDLVKQAQATIVVVPRATIWTALPQLIVCGDGDHAGDEFGRRVLAAAPGTVQLEVLVNERSPVERTLERATVPVLVVSAGSEATRGRQPTPLSS